MDHVGIVVDDLAAATEFFLALGLEVENRGSVEGSWVDRIIGLEDARSDLVEFQTPDGTRCLEVIEFKSPAYDGETLPEPSNAPGLRHITFAVEGLDDVVARLREHGGELVGEIETYEDIYRLCYLRGPAGIIIELAEALS